MIDLYTGAVNFDPSAYGTTADRDRVGRTVKRGLVVVARLPDTSKGAAVWECECRCRRRYALTDDQINNPRFEPCACNQR
jgi:hypothetical protein